MAATKGSRNEAHERCLFLPLLTFWGKLMKAPFNVCYTKKFINFLKIRTIRNMQLLLTL